MTNQIPTTTRFQPLIAGLSLLTLLAAFSSTGLAAERSIELKWNELAPLIQGQRVELALREGAKIRGEAVLVRGDSLVIDVKKVSGIKAYRAGSASISRIDISLIKLERTHGNWGRNLGVTIGLLTGISVGGYVAGTATNSARAGIPLFLGIASAVTLAGYYTGRGLDGQTILIRITPE